MSDQRMLKFYRRLAPIKAISFDLDDTLYHNKPVMLVIEQKMIAYFADVLNAKQHKLINPPKRFNQGFWYQFRQQAISQQSVLTHDVVQVRLVSYRLGFEALGFTRDIAQKMAQAALDYFIRLRSDFAVPDSSKRLLATLSSKYPLVAISNGNVDTKVLGISHYFQH
ncbi:MAG: HAD family hydrolase, partial [Colwellia sp.]|nr:HAD family hydrolase [Colwellia sp.]